MGAGDRRYRLEIQTPPNWGTLATWWASATDVASVDDLEPTVTTRFEGLPISGVTHRHRLLWEGQPYDIVSVLPNVDGRKRTMQILATRKEMAT